MYTYWMKYHWRYDLRHVTAPAYPPDAVYSVLFIDRSVHRSLRIPRDWTDSYIGLVKYERELSEAELSEYFLEKYTLRRDLEVRWTICKRSVSDVINCLRRY